MTKLPVIGILGIGVIGSALAHGFATADPPYPLLLSSLDKRNMTALASSFPERITLATDNQQMLDRADWVILAIPPAQSESILRSLRFRPDHKVINLLADKSLEQIAEWIGPTALLAHMVPLSFVSQHFGPIVVYPRSQELIRLMAPLGEIIVAGSPLQVHVFQSITGLMASFDTLLDYIVHWAGDQGVEELSAKAYATSFFGALCKQAAQATAERLHELAGEMTPGGINAMVKRHLEEHNSLKNWIEALNPVMARLAAAKK
ncbi:MAG: NAD(P)-binding domain-containing protein [Bacteroidetes bacterium]|nr:NAD(P)-binding domain-containing protein [Bacteroidota bacterium]